MKIKAFHIYFFLTGTFLISACNSTKYLKDNEYLLRKNRVNISGEKKNIEKDVLTGLIEQTPNKQFMGIRFKMWFYYFGLHGKDKPINRWFKNKIGEPPVIFEPRLASNALNQIKSYLNNIGYFDSKVDYYVEYKQNNRQKVKVHYNIRLSEPYRINKHDYSIPDPEIRYYILKNSEGSLIDSNRIYNAYTLEEERNRITQMLKNKGYYNFSKEYIFFEADTTIGHKQLNIITNIKNRYIPAPGKTAKYIEKNHRKYYIKNIYINTDYNPLVKGSGTKDTLSVKMPRYSNPSDTNFYILTYSGHLRLHPTAITQSIFINNNQPFNLKDVQQTYKRLSDVRFFKYADIQFNEAGHVDTSDNSRLLDCHIQLSRSKLQAFTVEAEGTNTGGDLGIGANLTYQNKNIFRSAEILTLRLKGSMEVQRLGSVKMESKDEFLFFNTIQTGAEAILYFPRFLVPVPQTTFPKYFKPKTSLTVGVNYQKRPLYRRYIANLSFGYDWSESKNKKHIFFPFDLNSVKVFPTAELDSIINNLKDERLRNQYTDHLIPSMKYSYIYNNQEINKLKNFIYFRGNIETSGNIFNAIDQFIKAPKNEEGYYTLFNIRYAQYIRLDVDLRYYILLNENSRIAVRGVFGIGVPYGNSDDLPFEKGFYGGGANGMRGWRFRSLGPGTYRNADTDFDRMGDMKLEGNIEYRFPVYRFLKSAIFVDAGNIWLLTTDDSFPGGKFEFNDFIDEMAMDAGIGLRFDFGFFVFRIDGALPIRDPSLTAGERWTLKKIELKRLNWNIGIGYPF